MKSRVYIETTVLSYLTAWPSRDLVRAAHQQVTVEWWAARDAVHVSIATVHGMDFLLTWNCTHIANAVMRPKIEKVCRSAGFEPPTICTPEELQLEESP